jgi:flagellar M-ring protein FliF
MPEPMVPPAPPRAPEQLALPPADPVARLRSMMKERHDESVKILTGWIDNKENAL